MTRTIFLLIYNIIRNAICKVLHPTGWNVNFIQRISPLCSLKIFDSGKLFIGRNTELAAYCDLEVHGHGVLEIGERTYMNRYCMISAQEQVSIGTNCMFGPGVRIFDNNHKHTSEEGVSSSLKTAPITIGDNCWICSNVIILKGSHIGKNCVIGAGCIIHGEIPDGSIVQCKQNLEIQ